jgi:hypothetical protein
MKYLVDFLLFFTLLSLSGCKPDPYPAHPDYAIKKPEVRYTPKKKNLEKMVKQLQGSPYVWAEEGPDVFDCSGFTYYLYGSMGIEIPRVAREQAKTGKRISPKALQYGDLIFFATDRRHPRKITHVGIYLGDGWFTHASTVKEEVIYSNLFTSPYYKKHLRICRRYLPETDKVVTAKEKPWRTQATGSTLASSTPISRQNANQGKAIVIKAPMSQLEKPHAQGNYYVQIGSFSGHPNDALLYKISRLGFHYKIITFPKAGKRINKLLAGPYKRRKEAEKALEKIRTHLQKNAFIAEIR